MSATPPTASLLAVPELIADAETLTTPEIVLGATGVSKRIQKLMDETKYETSTFAPGGPLSSKRVAEAKARGGEAFTRGIKARSIYLSSVRKDATTLSYIEWLSENGVEVRSAASLPVRMIISDQKTAILPLGLGDAMQGIAVYQNPLLVKALQALFDFVWDSASPIGPKMIIDKSGFSKIELSVLEHLAHGKDDQEIAAKLAVSDRTIRTHTKTILSKLNANTRSQAIYKATKLSLI